MILLIKKYRNRKNISLRQLSRLTGFSSGYLSKLECNKKNPRLSTIKIIGQALETCPIKLFGGCDKRLCSNRCYYYRNRYNDFPIAARKEISQFMRYIKKKYN